MRYPYYNRIFRARPLFYLLRLFFITATSTILILVLSYEPHIELAFYPRKWISSQILTLAPLSECFNPDNMQGTGYNVTKHLHGPKRNTVNPGIQMRFGMDCYDYAGTVQARWEDRPKPRREGEVLPGEERVQFHTYWRTDLAPFGERQEYMLKSFFATQNLESSRLVLWSNGDLSSSPLLRGYLKRYPEAFTLRIVNIPRLARGTKLEESDRLGTKDERAWVDGDLIRLLLLWNYGGVWVDMDSLLTRDLDPLLEHEFVTQWDCYDKPYSSLNGALMRFHQHSPYLCEAFHIIQTSPPPRTSSTDWGSLLYLKLFRRLIHGGVPPFQILPFCFSDGRSCRLDNRLPDPFEPDPQPRTYASSARFAWPHFITTTKTDPRDNNDDGNNLREKSATMGFWAFGLGREEEGGLDEVLTKKVFGVHLHNQWERSFPRGGWVERLLLKRYENVLDGDRAIAANGFGGDGTNAQT